MKNIFVSHIQGTSKFVDDDLLLPYNFDRNSICQIMLNKYGLETTSDEFKKSEWGEIGQLVKNFIPDHRKKLVQNL